MDPYSGVDYGLTLTNESLGDYFYNDVWNGNLWVSSWIGGGIAASLVGELMLASKERRSGVVGRNEKPISSTRLRDVGSADGEVYMRTFGLDEDRSSHWFLMLVTSCALSAFCIDYRTGVSCEGTLSSTPFCKRCILGSTVGLLCAVISIGAIVVHFKNLRERMDESKQTPHQKLWFLEAFCSTLSFILSCINVGFVTSPGSPGAEIGNIFLTAWVGAVISLVLCVRVGEGCILRLTLDGVEPSDDKYVNRMIDDEGCTEDQYPEERHRRKQQTYEDDVDVPRKKVRSPKVPKKQAPYKNDSEMPGCKNNKSPGPRRVFISKATERKGSSSSDSSSSSSSDSNSMSLSKPSPGTEGVQRMDTSGDHTFTSGEKTTSTYSLPPPPPICLDSSSDDHNLSRPSLSPTLNSINGGQTSSRAMHKTGTPSSAPPPPPYNAYGFSYSPNNQSSEFSIEEEDDDDDESAIEICVDHPDDVSSLGVSMLSLGQSGHSNVDPDGYKSEDNYITSSPHPNKQNKRASKRASRGRQLSDELPTVGEEQSMSTQSRIESSTIDYTTERIMNLRENHEEGAFSRLDSNASSVGPITVDESVSYVQNS
jgi:hypothetical protein